MMAKKPRGVLGKIGSYARWFLSSLTHSSFLHSRRELVIVSGADSSHFRSALQFLTSATECEPDSTIVFWDLGLTEGEREEIAIRFPSVHCRRFPYDEFPSYFVVTEAKGEYAWKPVIVQKSAEEFASATAKTLLLWCDAGNVIFRKLRWLRRYTVRHGVFAPFSRGTLKDWTHPDTLAHFRLEGDDVLRSNCASGFVGFDLVQAQAQALMREWSDLALNKDVFAPEGSSRANHRQDQAVLSCMLVRDGILSDGSFRTNWTEEYLTGQDIDKSGAKFRQKPKNLLLRLLADIRAKPLGKNPASR